MTFHSITLHYFPLDSMTFHDIPLHSIPLDSMTFHYIPLNYFPSFHSIRFHDIPLHSIELLSITFHSITFHNICISIDASRDPNGRIDAKDGFLATVAYSQEAWMVIFRGHHWNLEQTSSHRFKEIYDVYGCLWMFIWLVVWNVLFSISYMG